MALFPAWFIALLHFAAVPVGGAAVQCCTLADIRKQFEDVELPYFFSGDHQSYSHHMPYLHCHVSLVVNHQCCFHLLVVNHQIVLVTS
jgi:hypothetical protein